MMKVSEFTELYNEHIFRSAENSVSFSESEEHRDAYVKNVELYFKGAHFDYCGENIWKDGGKLYRGKSCDFQFAKRCDGFAFCQKDNVNYLIWVELKTGFPSVFTGAIYQISACYIKMKSYLRTISTYNSADYEELAIIVSLPEGVKNPLVEENDNVLSRRNSGVSNEPSVSDKYRQKYKQTGGIEINAEDFGSDKLHLVPDILPSNLRVVHYVTTQQNITIDLSTIL